MQQAGRKFCQRLLLWWAVGLILFVLWKILSHWPESMSLSPKTNDLFRVFEWKCFCFFDQKLLLDLVHGRWCYSFVVGYITHLIKSYKLQDILIINFRSLNQSLYTTKDVRKQNHSVKFGDNNLWSLTKHWSKRKYWVYLYYRTNFILGLFWFNLGWFRLISYFSQPIRRKKKLGKNQPRLEDFHQKSNLTYNISM